MSRKGAPLAFCIEHHVPSMSILKRKVRPVRHQRVFPEDEHSRTPRTALGFPQPNAGDHTATFGLQRAIYSCIKPTSLPTALLLGVIRNGPRERRGGMKKGNMVSGVE